MLGLDLHEENKAEDHEGRLGDADEPEGDEAAQEDLVPGEVILLVEVFVLLQVLALGVGVYQHAGEQGADPQREREVERRHTNTEGGNLVDGLAVHIDR